MPGKQPIGRDISRYPDWKETPPPPRLSFRPKLEEHYAGLGSATPRE